MVTVFALASALLYGSADFLGGVATRRARALSILPASAFAGLVIVLVAAVASGGTASLTGLAWGLAAGGVGGVGLIVFYAGLAEGPMTIVAPTSALSATVLPVAVSLAEGERATPAVYGGALICLAAIVLVSAAGTPRVPKPGEDGDVHREAGAAAAPAGLITRLAGRGFHVRAIGFGLAAGATFGLFFIFLRNAGQSGTLWPVVASRLGGLVIIILAAAVDPDQARHPHRRRAASGGDLRLGAARRHGECLLCPRDQGRPVRPGRRPHVALSGRDGAAGEICSRRAAAAGAAGGARAGSRRCHPGDRLIPDKLVRPDVKQAVIRPHEPRGRG